MRGRPLKNRPWCHDGESQRKRNDGAVSSCDPLERGFTLLGSMRYLGCRGHGYTFTHDHPSTSFRHASLDGCCCKLEYDARFQRRLDLLQTEEDVCIDVSKVWKQCFRLAIGLTGITAEEGTRLWSGGILDAQTSLRLTWKAAAC